MKKLLALLLLCVVFAFCTFSFTACDFNSQQNTGSEITNEQSENKDNNEEQEQNQGGEEDNNGNNEEEKVVIDKDTDFDALESDKVEKDVFINAFVFLGGHCSPYIADANVNCTIDVQEDDLKAILKIDGLKRFVSETHSVETTYTSEDGSGATASGWHPDAYLFLAEDFQYYFIGGIVEGRAKVEKRGKGDLWSPDIQNLTEIAEEIWENAIYNETTKQYEGDDVEYDRPDIHFNIKIKDGYIVYCEAIGNDGHKEFIKCYDIGMTVVDIPADILAEMNAKK